MNVQDATKQAADLYWLAFLLTGRRDAGIDIAANTAVSPPDPANAGPNNAGPNDNANPFFANWLRAWSRRNVIAGALAAIHDELAESARRTELAHLDRMAQPPREWSPSPETSRGQIEEALLAIDVFPRAAVLLLIFEGVKIADAATLLGASVNLVRKAQVIGLRELAANLARSMEHQVSDPSLSRS